jgi:putative transposase
LAQPSVQKTLHEIWEQKAKAWLVTDYVLMPDHLHLFCAPGERVVSIERWIAFWKDSFAKTYPDAGTFQRGGVHHRLRDGENYGEKWRYVRENPVRKQFVERAEDWPYFGCVHRIRWSGE